MKPIEGDSLRGHLETIVLAALGQGAAHGLEIMRRLHLRGCGVLRLKEGSLYPALYRLEGAGLIRGEWEEAGSGRRGPRRRVYSITSKGSRKLAQQRAAWTQFVDVVGSLIGAPA